MPEKEKVKTVYIGGLKFEDGRANLGKKWELIYDSGAALEPFYYFILDFAKDQREMKVIKIYDWYSFSYRSPEWASQQTKLHYSITDATSLLQQIGAVIKSLVGMKKDYQRVKEALEYYEKDKKVPPDLVLKGIWADYVDVKSGPASLVQTAKNLQFYSVRDWFFRLNSEEEIDKAPINDRIKNYLKRKLREYLAWKKEWKKSLEEMKEILEERIKATKGTVELYKKWVAPIIRDVEALAQKQELFDPNLIKIGSSVYSQVKVLAYRDDKKYGDFIPGVEITFTLRGTSPRAMTKTYVDFVPVLYIRKELEKKMEEWKKDPIEKWVQNLMLQYEFGKKEEKKEEKEEPKTFVGEIIKSIKENYFKGEKKARKPLFAGFYAEEEIEAAKKKALEDAWSIYDVTKKAFRMLSWPVEREF